MQIWCRYEALTSNLPILPFKYILRKISNKFKTFGSNIYTLESSSWHSLIIILKSCINEFLNVALRWLIVQLVWLLLDHQSKTSATSRCLGQTDCAQYFLAYRTNRLVYETNQKRTHIAKHLNKVTNKDKKPFFMMSEQDFILSIRPAHMEPILLPW